MPAFTFLDVNHDGHAAEFVIAHAGIPCGEREAFAYGLTVNGEVGPIRDQDSGNMLTLESAQQWIELAHTANSALEKGVEFVVWNCGRRGIPEEYAVVVRLTKKGLTAVQRAYECSSPDGIDDWSRGDLAEETPYSHPE